MVLTSHLIFMIIFANNNLFYCPDEQRADKREG